MEGWKEMQVPYHTGHHLPAHRTSLAGATGERVLFCSHGPTQVMPAWAALEERPGAEQAVTSLRQEAEGC